MPVYGISESMQCLLQCCTLYYVQLCIPYLRWYVGYVHPVICVPCQGAYQTSCNQRDNEFTLNNKALVLLTRASSSLSLFSLTFKSHCWVVSLYQLYFICMPYLVVLFNIGSIFYYLIQIVRKLVVVSHACASLKHGSTVTADEDTLIVFGMSCNWNTAHINNRQYSFPTHQAGYQTVP